MMNITSIFDEVYDPIKLFAVLKSPNDAYVEAYDLDNNNKCPINAHPLSVDELRLLDQILSTSCDFSRSYLKPAGLLPDKVLYINPESTGFVVWHSAPQAMRLRFVKALGIPEGIGHVPGLIWKADKNDLYIFAHNSSEKPNLSSKLYAAPLFNIGRNGHVCMGTVQIGMDNITSLEEFIRKWEINFFESYFSHLIVNSSPIKGNIVQLWNKLINTNKPFPIKVLKETTYTIKSLLR